MKTASRQAWTATVLWVSSITAVVAGEGLPGLQLPVACEMGVVCHIQNHVDHDPGDGFLDYHCGPLGYDGHDGTDIRVSSLAVMRRGVAVVAAAAGRVRAIRDEMPDVNVRDIGRDAIRKREAGNAVVLQHGDDWETQYSHLRRGSVAVRPGDVVEAGDVLGLIGLSGNTEFPHLHFEVRYQGRPVDPFVGQSGSSDCDTGEGQLWQSQALEALRYRPTGLLQAGFASSVPDRRAVEAGNASSRQLVIDADALLFWVELFGAQKGDRESIEVFAPDGELIASRSATIQRHKARWFSYAGRKRRGDAWPSGRYRANYRLLRNEGGDARPVIDIERTILVN